MDDHIKLYRKSINSQVFKNEKMWKVWSWCLMKAQDEEGYVEVKTGRGKTQVKLKPGQFVFGRHTAAEELNLNPETIRKIMGKLTTLQNITNQSTNHYTVVSIVNWDIYQLPQKKVVPRKVPTKYQPSTNQKKTFGEFKNVQLTQIEYDKLLEKFGQLVLNEKISDLSIGIASKGYKYKDHYATILSWDRKEKRDGKQANNKRVIDAFLRDVDEEANGEDDQRLF